MVAMVAMVGMAAMAAQEGVVPGLPAVLRPRARPPFQIPVRGRKAGLRVQFAHEHRSRRDALEAQLMRYF